MKKAAYILNAFLMFLAAIAVVVVTAIITLKKFYHLSNLSNDEAFNAEMKESYTAQASAKHADITSTSESDGSFKDD